MSDHNKQIYPSIIPSIRYKDAQKALLWLKEAFGFEQHLLVPGDNNTISHAQLVLGNGMIMIGSSRDDFFGKHQKPLQSSDSPVSQSPYIIIDEIDLHYQNAVAAGAEIILELEEQPQGGKLYSCRDFEGNLWNFGSYNPWN